ncbi:MAG: LON peptidase substrate-binding domain-containing protein [Gammaproteobacteria bacterium]
MSGTRLTDIPLFPLNTVLFPGGFLPLRIFEPRYLEMVASCMQQQSPFGVVLIRQGGETGAPAETFEVGTLAAIVDFDKGRDGLLMISCIGGDRFRILDRQLEPNRLQRARIEVLAAGEDTVLPPEYLPLAGFLRAVVNQPGISRRIAPPDIDYGSPRELGYRLAELLPVPVQQQQQLLEIDDPLRRLAEIETMLRGMEFTLEA